MKVWKVLGVAGLAGVAATGAIVARNERRRTQMTPDEIRERLRQRHAGAAETPADPPDIRAPRARRGRDRLVARLRRGDRQ
ncbi:hypothetical protein [Nocardioides pacificus]